ncbi:MAG: hypothetical protein FWD57_03225, partial [Polyangiaceae bacterium]|nr:hypothetical protein [Polyangiaceae bacterium]
TQKGRLRRIHVAAPLMRESKISRKLPHSLNQMGMNVSASSCRRGFSQAIEFGTPEPKKNSDSFRR